MGKGLYEKIEIDPLVNTYELNEVRYIRKHRDGIIRKARLVYEKRKENADEFLKKTCCDFEKLESHYMEYK